LFTGSRTLRAIFFSAISFWLFCWSDQKSGPLSSSLISAKRLVFS
jgi:hypothetical protein